MLILNKCEVCNSDYKSKNISKYCSNKCRSFIYRQRKIKGVDGIDYVICAICKFKFKEINNDHMKTHNLTCDEYDYTYNINRTSEKTRLKKDTLSVLMTSELSKKLSRSHTLEGFKEKYGDREGELRYEKKISKMKFSKSIEYYIEKYEYEGVKKFNEDNKKRAMSLENLMNKYPREEAEERYKKWKEKHKIKNTISYYIKLYGEDEGTTRWFNRNNNISIANSKIEDVDRKDFNKYITNVEKFTRISLNLYDITNSHLRGLEYGYDLDHIVSKIDGFRNNIEPEIIAHISNLRIIESSINRQKQQRSDKDINEIIDGYNKDENYKNIINEYYKNI
jgi:hypothetical protein